MSDLSEDSAERARKYIATLEETLEKLSTLEKDTMASAVNILKVSDAINRYLQDARFYLKNGKPITALGSIAYAEGLLDALTFLELAKMKTTQ
jgi:hypothetical protein